jgi:SET domain-containing protein
LRAPRQRAAAAAAADVHSWGLFADETIEKEAFVIEYIGELIRPCLADRREQRYTAAGMTDCLFR